MLSIKVLQAPPVISSVSPTSGPAAGGTKVIITGEFLQGASSVLFGTQPAAKFRVNKAGTKIEVYAPAGSAGPAVDITVRTLGGLSPSSSSDQFTYT
jgi:hypothetical protein